MNDEVTLSKEEYNNLLRDQNFLNILTAYGVDNWSGYGDAVDKYEERYESK